MSTAKETLLRPAGDLDATADRTRTDRAFADFLGTLEHPVR